MELCVSGGWVCAHVRVGVRERKETVYRIFALSFLRNIDSNCCPLAVSVTMSPKLIKQISNECFYKYLNKHCDNCIFSAWFSSNFCFKSALENILYVCVT